MNRREKKEREAQGFPMICGNCGSDNYRFLGQERESRISTFRCNVCGNEWMEYG